MKNIFKESKDYEMDNELKIYLNHEPASFLHFEPTVIYMEHIEMINGSFIEGMQKFRNLHSKWWNCKGFRTY